jgi:hypothetical protein
VALGSRGLSFFDGQDHRLVDFNFGAVENPYRDGIRPLLENAAADARLDLPEVKFDDHLFPNPKVKCAIHVPPRDILCRLRQGQGSIR